MVVPAGAAAANLRIPPAGLGGGGVVLGGLAVQPVGLLHKSVAKANALMVADEKMVVCSCSLPRLVITVARASSIFWPAANSPGSMLSITSCEKIFNAAA